MDDVGVGRLLRAIRIRRGWRQADVASRAGVSRAQVSRAERGNVQELRLRDLRAIGTALEVRCGIDASWRGGDADRVVNDRHVALQQVAVVALMNAGWEVAPEVTFVVRGVRGIVDLLAWHAATQTLLVVETKTDVADVDSLIAQVGRYERVARTVARDRGWSPRSIGVWVAVAESSMNRRRVAAAALLLRAAFPSSGRDVARWLAAPGGRLAALSFLAIAPSRSTGRSGGATRRVSRARRAGSRSLEPS